MLYYEKIAERIFNVAKVYEFPNLIIERKLSKDIEEKLEQIAKDYIDLVYANLMILSNDGSSQNDFKEINELVSRTFAKEIEKTIDEL